MLRNGNEGEQRAELVQWEPSEQQLPGRLCCAPVQKEPACMPGRMFSSSLGKRLIKALIKGGSHRVKLSSFVLLTVLKNIRTQ